MAVQNRSQFLAGPVVGLLLAALAWEIGFGPGFLTLAAFGTIGFVLITPLIQLLLHRTDYFRSRTAMATSVSLMVIVLAIMAAIASGKFFYW